MRWLRVGWCILLVAIFSACGEQEEGATPTTPLSTETLVASVQPTYPAAPPTSPPWPTPPFDLSQRIAGCVEANANAQEVETALETCFSLQEFGARAIVAEGDVPVVLLGVGGGCASYVESFVLWQEGDAWRVQSLELLLPFAYDRGTSIVSNSLHPPPNGTFVQGATARVVSDGSLRSLGSVVGQAGCGSGPFQSYILLSLVGQQWTLSWEGRQAWFGLIGQTGVEFAGDGLNAIHVSGTSYGRMDEKSHILAEHKIAPVRSFDQIWVRQGEAYILAEEHVKPSGSNTLLEFLYRLSSKDEAGASALVTDGTLVATAQSSGLVRDTDENEWSRYCEDAEGRVLGPFVGWPCVLQKPDGTAFRFTFVESGGDWLISAIDPCKYWYDPASGGHCD